MIILKTAPLSKSKINWMEEGPVELQTVAPPAPACYSAEAGAARPELYQTGSVYTSLLSSINCAVPKERRMLSISTVFKHRY